MANKCDICGGRTIAMHPTMDGSICHKCFMAAGYTMGADISGKPTADLKPEPATLDAGVVKCAKCGSTSITANEKGFGIGKAITGVALTGVFGLMAGNIGAKKVYITCLNCGHRWKAGKS